MSPDPIAVILPAAGSGTRFGTHQNKLFAVLAGRPIWQHSVQRFLAADRVTEIIMPVSDVDRDHFAAAVMEFPQVALVPGGSTRTESVRSALIHLAARDFVGLIAVHDAARPLIRSDQMQTVFSAADQYGAAILAIPVTATLKRGQDQTITGTVDRSDLWEAQTPQVFDVMVLRDAYQTNGQTPATDDAELVQRTGHPVRLVRGCSTNIKITLPGDLAVAEAIYLNQQKLDAATQKRKDVKSDFSR